MILKQGATRVRVCPYRCLAQWHVESHPGPGVSWTGSRLPRHTSSPATAAAAPQRTHLAASPPSTSRANTLRSGCICIYRHSHWHIHPVTHIHPCTQIHTHKTAHRRTRRKAGSLLFATLKKPEKKERKKTHKANSVSSLWLKMWHLKKVREVEKEEKPVKLNSRVQTH